MIHQLIFGSPRPGMTEADFQEYWTRVHAIRYASRIPQIHKYLVASRVDCAAETAPRLCGGVAEIWFQSEAEQLASLQSPEFLDGARRDEPTWAAFWRTLVLDTDTTPSEDASASGTAKLYVLVRRRAGMDLAAFREFCRERLAPADRGLPGLRGYAQCFTRDGSYAVGEAPLDAAFLFWFDDAKALDAALRSDQYAAAESIRGGGADPAHRHAFAATPTWIIGPEGRAAGPDRRLVAAACDGSVEAARAALAEGARVDGRDPGTGLTALMLAAGRGDAVMVELLLGAGADATAVDTRAGATALHKACQSGSVACLRLLCGAGAFVDAAVGSTGHTPLIEAIWYTHVEAVEHLLGAGARLEIPTHYGFTLADHLAYALKVNTRRREQLTSIQILVEARRRADATRAAGARLLDATARGDLAAARAALGAGAQVDERYPMLSGFNDAHTPLLVAARDGHAEIVALLLDAGADVNAVEPTFGAVPLHKAVYNGHVEITRRLASWPGVALDPQGPTNGYTPLLDAIWHGFEDCTMVLLAAGARTDLRGHDGRRPLDLAREVFGESSAVVAALADRT